MKLRNLFILGMMALLVGCFKDTSFNTTYVLKPLVQDHQSDPVHKLERVIAYTYAVDTALWDIVSYEDALAGILTSKTNPEEKLTEPTALATPYLGPTSEDGNNEHPDTEGDNGNGGDNADAQPSYMANEENPEPENPDNPNPDPLPETTYEGWLQMPIGAPQQMIVAVDLEHKTYAFTSQLAVLNLPELFVSVTFQTWREGKEYRVGNWIFRNDYYQPPVSLKAYVDVKWQETEGGELTATQTSRMKVYAHQVDSVDWRIASYDDAVSGRLTNKKDEKLHRDTPDFKAYVEEDGRFGMTIKGSPLMVVVVDRVHKLYAYKKITPDLEGESPTWSLVLRLWQQEAVVGQDGWTICNEYLDKQEPQPQPAPEQ